MTVYDLGAFQRLLTLLFASRTKIVVCFEPHTQNRKRLMENLRLNGIKNLQVRKTGVGSRRETRRMQGTISSSDIEGWEIEALGRARDTLELYRADVVPRNAWRGCLLVGAQLPAYP